MMKKHFMKYIINKKIHRNFKVADSDYTLWQSESASRARARAGAGLAGMTLLRQVVCRD